MHGERPPKKVLIAGGGIAAIEAVLALKEMTSGAAEITLLSASREFVYRPLLVLEPFSPELASRRDLPAIAAELGVEFVEGRLVSVDDESGVAITDAEDSIPFDRLIVAVGARSRPAFESAHTLWGTHTPTPVDVLIERGVERGGLDLIVPPGTTWALPLYEFALMLARRTRERGEAVALRLITPEERPLLIFGPAASDEVAELLATRGISVLAAASVEEAEDGVLRTVGAEAELSGYPVALPRLEGPRIQGLPADDHGFLPIDLHARVRGTQRTYAAGDATDFPVEQGGIATQQADAAAEAIAAEMSPGDGEPAPFHPILRGKLLTGGESVSMRNDLAGGDGEGLVSSDFLWWPPHKVSGRFIAPWLAQESLHLEPAPPPVRSIDVEVALPGEWHPDPMRGSASGPE